MLPVTDNSQSVDQSSQIDQEPTWLECLAIARTGDPESLGQLFEQVRNYLLLVAQRELDDAVRVKVGASDLVQQTMLEAGRDVGSFRGETQAEFNAWLIRILRHNLTDTAREYRGTKRRNIEQEKRLAGNGENLACSQRTASSIYRRVEADEQLEQAVALLPEQYRAVISLRHVNGLSWSEVGQQLALTSEAARKVWARALAKLREILASDHESRIESTRRATNRRSR